MRSRLLGAVLALAALPAMDTAARGQKIDPQEIVNQHWPAQLERPEGPVVSNTCHAAMATTAAGEPARIAAGYRDGTAVLRDRDVLAIDSFSPASSPDLRMLEALEFDLESGIGPGASVLRIINGDRNGRRRARGVSVTINGTALQEAAKLTASVEFLDISIPTA